MNSKELSLELKEKYGPLIGGADLRHVLGFKTAMAFEQAFLRKKLPITVFQIKNRKGKFAYTGDVIEWIVNLDKQGE